MAAAAADVVVERRGDFSARRGPVPIEQGLRRDEDAGEAIAALPGLLVEKGLLQRVRMFRGAQPLDRQNRLPRNGRQRLAAGFLRVAVYEHHARAALFGAAAEPRPGEAEMVAQHVEQRRIGVGRDADGVSIHDQSGRLHHSSRRRIEETISDCSVEGWWAMHVLICGGGVIGAATAYFLSCRGVRATVIERTGLACAASGKAMAELITEGKARTVDLSPFDPARLPRLDP